MSSKKNDNFGKALGKELKSFGKGIAKEGKGWVDTALGITKSTKNNGGGKRKCN